MSLGWLYGRNLKGFILACTHILSFLSGKGSWISGEMDETRVDCRICGVFAYSTGREETVGK